MKGKVPAPWMAVLAFGGACQIGQILFLREFLMVFHGNELSIGLILATWMFWAGVGSRFGYRIAEGARHPVRLLLWSSVMVAVILPATLPLIRGARHFHGALPGAHLTVPEMLATCLVLMAPAGVLLGLQFVLLARVWRGRRGGGETEPAGSVYIGEAAGAIIGGVLFTYFLVHRAGALQAAVLAGVFLILASWWVALRVWPWGADAASSPFRKTWLAVPAVGLLSLPWLGPVEEWMDALFWGAMAPEHRLVAAHPSKYGRIHVAERAGQYSFFQSGHLLFAVAGRGTSDAILEEGEAAAFAHLALAQHPDPRRILLVGGGLRGTLREILRHPVEQVDYVELDPVLLAAARPLLGEESLRALEDARVRLHHGDGRLFVKSTMESFDLILVDAPDPATAVLNRFYTREFFEEAAARLRPGGVVVVSALSTADLRGRAVANRNATLFHTLRAVFPEVLAIGQRTLYLFGSHESGVLSADPAVLRARHLERGIEANAFPPRRFDLLLEEGPLRRINWILRHHGREARAHLGLPPAAPLFPPPVETGPAADADLPPVNAAAFINSDFRPIGYFHTLVFWNLLIDEGKAPFFAWMARARPWWVAPPLVAALLAAILLRFLPVPRARRSGRAFAVRSAVFTTGLSTMSLQVALLFAFQATHGFVYEQVGLIVAVFMAGLLGGALLTQRTVRDKTDPRPLTRVQGSIALFAALMAVVLPAAGALPSPFWILAAFYGLTFMAGFFNGLDFPLATAACAAPHGRAEKSVGVVYGLELFGACAGAAVASAFIAPVLGIAACCYLAALANGTAFLILKFNGKTPP